MQVKVPFNQIQVNLVAFEGAEIVFPYESKWFRMGWNDVPDRFKQLYVLKLRLEGVKVPNALEQYIVNDVDVSDLSIELDLGKAEEVNEDYPIR